MMREEAIEYLHKLFMQADITDAYGDMDDTEPYETAIDMAVKALQAQKTGKWIKDEEQSREHTEPIFICSCCQNNSAWGTEERTRYCSFCGARMECES